MWCNFSWWKLLADYSWPGASVVQFNYGYCRGRLDPGRTGRRSFFWNGVVHSLPAFRSCIAHDIRDGKDTLFWLDGWLEDKAPMNLWPEEFRLNQHAKSTIHELLHLCNRLPFSDCEVVQSVERRISRSDRNTKDGKWWKLSGNRTFSVKSFYNFLIDGGLRCPVAKFFWSPWCPKKVTLFNWMALANKILTLENLARRRCNKLPSATCVLCHSDIESIDHLFFLCPVADQVWSHFIRLFQLQCAPRSMSYLWGQWRLAWPKAKREFGDLVSKAIVWNIWLFRNDCMFNNEFLPMHCLILKIGRMILFWLSSVTDSFREKCEEDISAVRRSLDFIGNRVSDASVVPQTGDGHMLEEA